METSFHYDSIARAIIRNELYTGYHSFIRGKKYTARQILKELCYLLFNRHLILVYLNRYIQY